MSALDRYRRMLGARAAQQHALPPAIPTIDACITRMDAPQIQDCVANKACGSVLFSHVIDPPVGGFALDDQLAQIPAAVAQPIIAPFATDQTKFFRPGHWQIHLSMYIRNGTGAARLRFQFLPWDATAKAYQERAFIGSSAGGGSGPNLVVGNLAGAGVAREWAMDFETFFPERWGLFIRASTAVGDNDTALATGALILHCPLDDAPEALDPTLS